MFRYVLFLMFFWLSPHCSAQDVSGSWEGKYTGLFSFVLDPDKLVVDIMMTNDSIVTGSSHLYYGGGKYEHYYISGIYRAKDSTIYFSEDSTIDKNVGPTCLGNYTMKLTLTDSTMRFDGRWRDNSKDFILLRCPSSNVWLEKKIPRKKKVAPDKNLNRRPEIQKMIEITQEEKDSIKIELLDNAQIDNDVVSVYVNDSIALSKKTLSAQPYVFYISIGKDQRICRIKLAAESMGSVPPCTALMVVTTKQGKKHNVLLSSNFGTNGTLELFLKE